MIINPPFNGYTAPPEGVCGCDQRHPIWVTRDKRYWFICEMTTPHLVRALPYAIAIERKLKEATEWFPNFNGEMAQDYAEREWQNSMSEYLVAQKNLRDMIAEIETRSDAEEELAKVFKPLQSHEPLGKVRKALLKAKAERSFINDEWPAPELAAFTQGFFLGRPYKTIEEGLGEIVDEDFTDYWPS